MKPYYCDLSQRLKDILAEPHSGPDVQWQIALRTLLQMTRPEDDALTSRVNDLFMAHKDEIREDVLDCGCYGGWLYGRLRAEHATPLNYHGIDLWEDAIRAARFMFPGARFEVGDLMNLSQSYDVIWCTQIIWRTTDEAEKTLDHLKRWTRKLLIFESPSLRDPVVWRP
jgi:SAM-dependent methyltransferase